MTSFRARDPDPEAQYTENIVLRQYLSSVPQLTTAIAKPSADETLEDALPERLKLLNGFPRTARFLAADPNKTLVIVRRFDDAAIRNLLLLEGRVAALEAVQKKLDEDDYAIYKTNDTLTKAASSWEHFALLGSFDTEDSKIPEAAFDLWCSSRIAVLEAKARENSEMPDQLKDKNYKEIEFILHRNQTLQKEIDKCDLQLRLISDPAQRPTSGRFEAEDWVQDRSRRLKLLESRQDLITERRYWLGYDEKEILEVKRRWEVSKALESALKDYQEAVLRYRDMLKLEEPADRSDDVLSRWVLGKFKTNAGTQKPSRQFLPGSAMDGVYQEGKQLKPNLLKCIFLTLLGRRQHLKTERHGTKPLVKDRVGVGRIASVDHLSRAISRFDFILKWGRDSNFEYPEVNYIPEKFLNRIVTFYVLVIAAILLVGAIWFLWLVQIKQPYQSVQLALLTFFIVAFGFALNFMTTATRDQVFGATAAYAAVLVVFVGSNTNGQGGVGRGTTNTTAQALIA